MRKESDIFKREPFDEDYEKFNLPPTAIKEADGSDLTNIANNELIINSANELLIRRGNGVIKVGV